MDYRLRNHIAKALRGSSWSLSWEEISAKRRRHWLEMADTCLLAIDEYKRGNSVKAKIEKKLVPDWRSSWRWASMQLNALAAIIIGLALNNLDVIASVLSMAPPEVRAFVPIPVSIGIFATVAIVRLWNQNHKK